MDTQAYNAHGVCKPLKEFWKHIPDFQQWLNIWKGVKWEDVDRTWTIYFWCIGLAKKFANPPSGERTERRKKTSTVLLISPWGLISLDPISRGGKGWVKATVQWTVACFCKRGRKAYYLRAATSFICFHKGPKGFQMATQTQGSQKCMRRRSTWAPVIKGWFSRGWSVRGHRSSWVCTLTTLLSFLAS